MENNKTDMKTMLLHKDRIMGAASFTLQNHLSKLHHLKGGQAVIRCYSTVLMVFTYVAYDLLFKRRKKTFKQIPNTQQKITVIIRLRSCFYFCSLKRTDISLKNYSLTNLKDCALLLLSKGIK